MTSIIKTVWLYWNPCIFYQPPLFTSLGRCMRWLTCITWICCRLDADVDDAPGDAQLLHGFRANVHIIIDVKGKFRAHYSCTAGHWHCLFSWWAWPSAGAWWMKTPTIAAHGNINSIFHYHACTISSSIGIGSGIWYLDSVVMDGIDTSRQLPRKCVCPSNIERFRRAGRYIRLSVEHVLPHSSTWQNIGGRCSAWLMEHGGGRRLLLQPVQRCSFGHHNFRSPGGGNQAFNDTII